MISLPGVSGSLWARENLATIRLLANQPPLPWRLIVRKAAVCERFLASGAGDTDCKQSKVSRILTQSQHLILSIFSML
jgi:hypothetical protein